MAQRTARTPGARLGRVVAGVLLVLMALTALALTAGTAAAADGDPPPTPTPYGGLLERPAPSQVDFDQVLEVAMLAVGTVNGLVFAGAVIASRVRGSSHAATRRALSARTGRGRVSEAPRRSRSPKPTVGAGRR